MSSGYEIRPNARSVVRPKPRTATPRGDCTGCGRPHALTLDGLIRKHPAPGRAVRCPGARRKPVPGSIHARAQAPA